MPLGMLLSPGPGHFLGPGCTVTGRFSEWELPLLSAQLWSYPVGVRQLRAKALARPSAQLSRTLVVNQVLTTCLVQ